MWTFGGPGQLVVRVRNAYRKAPLMGKPWVGPTVGLLLVAFVDPDNELSGLPAPPHLERSNLRDFVYFGSFFTKSDTSPFSFANSEPITPSGSSGIRSSVKWIARSACFTWSAFRQAST